MGQNSKKTKNVNYLIFFFTFVALMFVYGTFEEFKKVDESENVWRERPQVDGTLDYAQSHSSGSTFYIKVKYTYSVDDAVYEGNTLGNVDSAFLNSAAGMQEFINKHELRENNTVKVYYNPENPAESRLFAHSEKNKLSGILCAVLSGFFFIIVLSLFLYKSKLKNKKEESAETEEDPALKEA